MVRVDPLLGYPAIWLQSRGRGILAIGLGVKLLIAAAIGADLADSGTDPIETTAR